MSMRDMQQQDSGREAEEEEEEGRSCATPPLCVLSHTYTGSSTQAKQWCQPAVGKSRAHLEVIFEPQP